MFRKIVCLVLIFFVVGTLAKGYPEYFDVSTAPILNKNASPFMGLPSSCAEAVAQQNNNTSGIYLLQLTNLIDPFHVNCIEDPWGGDPWSVIQRRQNGHVDFYRNFSDYELGFGNLNGEHFLGLKKLNAFTTFQNHELWVQLEDFEGDQRYAKYTNFTVGDYRANYTLRSVGVYSGNAGNSFPGHIGFGFSTKDVYNNKCYICDDDNNYACFDMAKIFKGAWWFGCGIFSHLNGQYYGKGVEVPGEHGINWYTFRGDYYSLKYAHMAIRPRTSK